MAKDPCNTLDPLLFLRQATSHAFLGAGLRAHCDVAAGVSTAPPLAGGQAQMGTDELRVQGQAEAWQRRAPAAAAAQIAEVASAQPLIGRRQAEGWRQGEPGAAACPCTCACNPKC